MNGQYPPFPLQPSPAPVGWPASPARSEEPGLSTGHPSHTHALEVLLTRLALAIETQTQALNKYAESNQDLIRAMAEDSGDGDDEPQGYLNAR